jgi:hypothetical protein
MFSKLKKNSLLICFMLLLLLIWQVLSANSQLEEFKGQLNEKGEKIAEQDQIILSQNDAIAFNLLQIEDLKKIKSQVTIRTITKIDSVYVPIIDTVERIMFDGDGIAFLKLPTKFGIEDEWYSLYSTLNSKGMWIDSLSLYNRQIVTLGLKSNGIFKSPTPTVMVKNENPYVDINSLRNVVIKNDTRFYDKKGFWYGVGVATGVLIPSLIK